LFCVIGTEIQSQWVGKHVAIYLSCRFQRLWAESQ